MSGTGHLFDLYNWDGFWSSPRRREPRGLSTRSSDALRESPMGQYGPRQPCGYQQF